MPKFTTISMTEAKVKTMPSAGGAKIIAEYVGYIEQAEREGNARRHRVFRRREPQNIEGDGWATPCVSPASRWKFGRKGDRLIFWSKKRTSRPGRGSRKAGHLGPAPFLPRKTAAPAPGARPFVVLPHTDCCSCRIPTHIEGWLWWAGLTFFTSWPT